ncbi:hypothetical protein V1J52_19665 [Streptomyces sp. TRM 70351]|uniref:hypothetical protein n=1 Tax=Streptomyces sp. TRM 70351 TaxID=3116552 RepID=UPI002E7B79D1|nr:hypothetical protein [Streptomyces sp. TRM 70351]MEE1930372.1 hypothetical protein [Streptomyces sp. TRM 70351]
MSDEDMPATQQELPTVPAPTPGSLVMDVARGQVGEFRCVRGGLWSLRPIEGGQHWTVAPADTRPVTPRERLRAETTRRNARSRGALL